MPKISVFETTNRTCSPILVERSYTGLLLASIDINEVRASIKVALFNRNNGTYPIISLKSRGPFIIWNLDFILIVI